MDSNKIVSEALRRRDLAARAMAAFGLSGTFMASQLHAARAADGYKIAGLPEGANSGDIEELKRRIAPRQDAPGRILTSLLNQATLGDADIIDITQAPYNCDPTGSRYSSPGFQDVLTALCNARGGVVLVPPGEYVMDFPTTGANHAISLIGFGVDLSVFQVLHSGIAIGLNTYNVFDTFEAKDIGFAPTPSSGSVCGVGLSLTYSDTGAVGWVRANISNLCFGLPRVGYTVFMAGLRLADCKRANFTGINSHSNIAAPVGSVAVELTGTCIDLHFDKCFLEGSATGASILSYSEGITFSNTVFITGVGVDTGSKDYNNGINVLGLYISNCEFNCTTTSVNAFNVVSGWLSNTHFSTKTAGGSAVKMVGCESIQINHCLLSGEFAPQNPASYTGLSMAGCTSCMADGLFCTNLTLGVLASYQSVSCTITGMRMIAPGGGALVGAPIKVDGYTIAAYEDLSFNKTNYAQWITSGGPMQQVGGGTPKHIQGGG